MVYSSEVKLNEQWNIFASDADGSNQSRLTEGETYDLVPVWSSDGSQIAFYSRRNNDGNLHLYTMASDGSGQHYIASTGIFKGATTPFWSPDNNFIAFIVPRYDGEPDHLYQDTDLYVAVADGSRLHRVEKMIGFPAWSPDSNRIAYLKHLRSTDKVALYTVGVNGSNLTRVYEFGDEFPTWYNIAEAKPSLDWSPNGTKILISHRNLIATVNTDGSDFQMLMRIRLNQSTQLRATWSPDGSKIVVAASGVTISYPPFPDKIVALFTMEPDGSNRRVIGWWLYGGGNDLRVIPGHNEPWPEHLRGLEARYD